MPRPLPEASFTLLKRDPSAVVPDVKGKRGRKTILDENVIEAVFSSVLSGVSLKDSAAMLGISEGVVYKWIERGRIDVEAGEYNTNHALFYENVQRAKAAFKHFNLQTIRQAAHEQVSTETTRDVLPSGEERLTVKARRFGGNWQAAAWLLERRHPSEFGRVSLDTKPDVSVNMPTEINITLKDPSNPNKVIELGDVLDGKNLMTVKEAENGSESQS